MNQRVSLLLTLLTVAITTVIVLFIGPTIVSAQGTCTGSQNYTTDSWSCSGSGKVDDPYVCNDNQGTAPGACDLVSPGACEAYGLSQDSCTADSTGCHTGGGGNVIPIGSGNCNYVPPSSSYTCYKCSGSSCVSYTSTDSTCGGTNCNSCSGGTTYNCNQCSGSSCVSYTSSSPCSTSCGSGCGGGGGGCGASCSSSSDCVPNSGLNCSGGHCDAPYCHNPIPSNSQGVYAYCQDGNGPIYPMNDLVVVFENGCNGCGSDTRITGYQENGTTKGTDGYAIDNSLNSAASGYKTFIAAGTYGQFASGGNLINGYYLSTARQIGAAPNPTPYGVFGPIFTGKNFGGLDTSGASFQQIQYPLRCYKVGDPVNDGGDGTCKYDQMKLSTGQLYRDLKPGDTYNSIFQNWNNNLGYWNGNTTYNSYSPASGWAGVDVTNNYSYPSPNTAGFLTWYQYHIGTESTYGNVFHFSNCQLCVAPGALSGLTPSNGSVLTETALPAPITLSWTADPNSVGYDIEVYPTGTSCQDSNAHCIYYSQNSSYGTTVPSYTFSANQKAWTFRARGVGGCTPNSGSKIGPWSAYSSFTLQANLSGVVEYIPDPNEAIVNAATSTCYNPNSGPETPTQPGAGSTVSFNNSATGPESSWIPISGDWNGTGTTYVGLYDPATSTFHLKTSDVSGAGDINFVFGSAGTVYIPVTGDWTGIGHTGVGLYNPANGAWLLKNNNSTGIADISFTYGPGNQGWFPVTGDWTGIGHTGVGLYNPANSNFYLKNDNTTGFADAQFQFGNPNISNYYLPISGDWTGLGKTTIGLYETATAQFFLRNTNTAGNANEIFVYGNANGGYSTVFSGKWAGGASSGVGLYIPDTTQFLLRNELSTGFADETFNYNASNGLSTANVNADGTFASIMLPYNTGTLSTLHITNPKYVCTCPADCSYGLYPPNAAIKYFISSNGLAWWQAQGGDVGSMAKDGHVVYDPISQLCQPPFCSPTLTSSLTPTDLTDFTAGSLTTAGSDGSTTFPTVQTQELGGYSSTPGNIASPPSSSFYAPSYPRIPPACRENYQFFYRLYSLGLNPQDDFSQQGNLRTDALLPYNPPLSSTGAYYTKGDMTINQPWVVPDNSTYVIFVDGKLTINNTITVPTDSFLAFITSDNIIVTPTVGTPTFTSPGPGQVQGLYVTNGTFTVQSAGSSGMDIKFIGEGSFAACQGINLQRDFNHGGHGDQNNENPADLFIYRPDLVKNVPKQMTHYHIDWHEVAP